MKIEWRDLLAGAGREDEAQLQRFLEQHPSMVPGGRSFPAGGHLPLFSAVITQPPLQGIGNHIPDFMWLAVDSATLYPVVVEIEVPSKKWFTQAGDPTAELTHAVRQLSDWQTWFKDATNVTLFRERFRIPDDEWRRLSLQPQFVLVYGSRAEFLGRDDLQRRRRAYRGALAADFFLMTFDGVSPDPVLDDTFCARLRGENYEAQCLSPPLRLGPIVARDLASLHDKDTAIDRTVWISDERRAFLKSRLAYWEAWAAAKAGGVIRGGDQE